MIYLSFEDVVDLHDALINRFGGLSGIREKGLLESSLAMPMMAVFGEELYKSIYDKAACYLFSIVKNHPFLDGNKRTASSVALVFLRINGETPRYNIDNFVEFVVRIAEGHFDIPKISKHLKKLCSRSFHSRKASNRQD